MHAKLLAAYRCVTCCQAFLRDYFGVLSTRDCYPLLDVKSTRELFCALRMQEPTRKVMPCVHGLRFMLRARARNANIMMCGSLVSACYCLIMWVCRRPGACELLHEYELCHNSGNESECKVVGRIAVECLAPVIDILG